MIDIAQTRPRLALNLSAGATSALVAFALVSLKLWGLGQTGALSVAASLADSAMDLMVSLGALAALIYAARPADDDHAFGHSSAEDLAALGQALFVLISAGVIATAAVLRLTDPNPAPLQAQGAGLIVMLISVALTALWHWRRRRCWPWARCASGAGLRRAILDRYWRCDVIIHKDVYHPTM